MEENKKRSAAAVSTPLIVIVIVLIAIAGVAIYYFALPQQPQATIQIGLIAPSGLAEGQDMDRAANMAVQEINNAGGIYVQSLGRHLNITLVTIDSGNADPTTGTTALTQALTQNNLTILIGGYSSRETMATEVVAIQNNLTFIITGASTTSVTTRTDYNTSYMFHYCATTDQYCRAIVHFYNDLFKPIVSPDRNLTLAILYRDDAFGQGVLNSCLKFINSDHLNITIVDLEKFTPGASDFKTQLQKIKAANPDALLTASFTAETSQIYIQGQQDVQMNTSYMAIENNDQPDFYTSIRMWGNYQLLESKFGPYVGPTYYLPLTSTFVSNYFAKYNMLPGGMGADTYDAFYIAKDAIERAGSLNSALIRDAIESTNMTQRLIGMQNGLIQFSTSPINYHEISPTIFIEQMYWNATLGECRPMIVWPDTLLPGVGYLNQTTFKLPPGYQPGGP